MEQQQKPIFRQRSLERYHQRRNRSVLPRLAFPGGVPLMWAGLFLLFGALLAVGLLLRDLL